MKIIAQINCYNSEDYIWYVLKSIYNFMDRIVVIDGAFSDDMPSLTSTDRTPTIVQGFDDPEGKLIYLSASSKTQIEQRNRIFFFTAGMDWLFLVDDDEVYKSTHLRKLRKFLENTPYNSHRVRGYNFVNSFEWYYKTDNMRLWKIKPRMHFQGPNDIALGRDKFHYHKSNAPVIPCAIRFHYSYVRDPERLIIKQKQAMEFQGDKKFPWRREGKFVIRDSWNREKYSGSHPLIMKDHPFVEKVWSPE